MSTFVFVPGAWHGGWAWDRVVPLLEEAGHDTVAVDVPCADPEAGCAAYAAVVLDAMDEVEEDAVLVAHSAGGLTLPLVANAAGPRVSRMVFVAALLPVVGRRFVEQDAEEGVLHTGYAVGVRRDPDGCRTWFDPQVAATYMYGDCAPQDAAWAFARLRPQGSRIYTEVSPLEALPDVPCVDIRAHDDRIVSTPWGISAARERLGVETRALDRGGHSLMLSRPADLAVLLTAHWPASGRAAQRTLSKL